MPNPLALEWLAGPPLSRSHWRLAPAFRIGRAAGSELELPDPAISRQHAAIDAAADGVWYLRDCGSRAGTRLNDRTLTAREPVAVRVGDVVGIGPWRFRVVDDAGERTFADEATRISVVDGFGRLAEQRLELLLRYAGEVGAAGDEQALADVVAEYALLGSGFSRAAVLWHAPDGIVVRSRRPVADAVASPLHCPPALLATAAGGELASLVAEPTAAATASALRRALCAPLLLDGRAEAFLYLDSPRAAGRRHADAAAFCHALARLAALALANLRRRAGERERAALAADLERAREVQRRLLPHAHGCLHGLRHALHLHPGQFVAGDLVDVIALAPGRVAAVLGDVSGAGLGAGLVMASAQSFLRAALEIDAHVPDVDPARVVTRLNAHLCAQASAGRFVTLWLGVFDSTTRRCRFVDAGHGHALVVSGDGRVRAPVTRGGIPLGIDDGARFEAEDLALGDGDTLLLYSDGLVEQRDRDGSAFGRDRLAGAIAHGAGSPRTLLAAVLAALRAHAGDAGADDDTSVLALGWGETDR